jgi:hypothetical protein
MAPFHLHFSGYIKLFNYKNFPLIKKIFYDLSPLDFNKYIDTHLNEITNTIDYWNKFSNTLNNLEEQINE